MKPLCMALALILVGCASYGSPEQHHAFCAGELGLERGTPQYAECRLIMKQDELARRLGTARALQGMGW